MENTWRLATVATVLALLALQIIQSAIEFQFVRLENQRIGSVRNADYYDETMATITSWLYTCRYLLFALGGLLACWLGHFRILQLGGCVILITTTLISVAIFLDKWSSDSALVICLLIMLINGLVYPNVMQGILSKRTAPRYRTILCALIFTSFSASAGTNVLRLEQLLPGHYNAIMYLAAALLYCVIALSLSLPCAKTAAALDAFRGAEEDAALSTSRVSEAVSQRIQLPTQNRLKRSCLVFAAFIPYLIGDESGYFFVGELSFQALKNASGGLPYLVEISSVGSSDPPTSDVRSVGAVASNLCLVVAACLTRRSLSSWRIPILPRLVVGIFLSIVLEILFAIFSSGAVGVNDHQTIHDVIVITASLIESVSAVLVMVAAYEVMDGFERDAARPLIVGVMLTVWGFANVVGRVIVMACLDYLPARLQFVYHVILALLLLISLLYIWFLAMPLAKSLTVTYGWESEDDTEAASETEPLIPKHTNVKNVNLSR